MSLAVVYARANLGIQSPLVSVEAHLSNGLPAFNIVGLPETAVKESKERVRSALLNSQLEFPDRRITINLAPADLPKSGGRFDLAIAIGILAASGQIPADSLENLEFMGELALSGEVRKVTAALPGIMAAQKCGRDIFIPIGNKQEAELLSRQSSFAVSHLLGVIAHLQGKKRITKTRHCPDTSLTPGPCLDDVIGQFNARRALTIAAAGAHNLLMVGPPGTGKTMLASRISSILPRLDEQCALETASLRSLASQGFDSGNWLSPPFRAPHHTASAVALVGGGSTLKVGEISLAHNGVLFLDELPEFSPKVLEVLREPLESGHISISRANYQVMLPARFQLLAAMNPCPCGHLGDTNRQCRCSSEKIKQYQSRVSGPLLDRIDLHIHVPALGQREKDQLFETRNHSVESSSSIRANVGNARREQIARAGKANAFLSQAEIRSSCRLGPENEAYMKKAMERLGLSTRAFFRLLKVSRTIADLQESTNIEREHLAEAIGFRFPGQWGE